MTPYSKFTSTNYENVDYSLHVVELDSVLCNFDHDFSYNSNSFLVPKIKSLRDYFDLRTVHKIIYHGFDSDILLRLFSYRPNL